MIDTPPSDGIARHIAPFLRISHALRFRMRRLYTTLVLARCYGRIGKGSVVFRQDMVRFPHRITIGERTIIRHGGRIEMVLHGQDPLPWLSIGDNVNIEQNVHIVCHGYVRIGHNVSITGNCAIVDVSHPIDAIERGMKIGDAIDPALRRVEIGDNCFIGFGSTVLPGVTIGKNCVIGAGSVVTRDIPSNSIASGIPARVLRSRTMQPARES
ncbi:acyltransferase [Sphingomonas sp. Leaf22]|uniref:acyltransferase n=1 Tax=Sphingomonas sp. Leaf22 TaxID=1735687 RepID=UPI000A52CDB4